MRLAYLVPEWPAQTHAFFWREAQALRELGHELSFVSTRRPDTPCAHEFAHEARRETTYLAPPSVGGVLTLARRWRKVAGVAEHLVSLRESSPRQRALVGMLVPSAAELVRLANERRIDHVHIHSCANAAHLGALSHALGGPPYSVTVHGDLSVYGVDHRAKMLHASFVSTVTAPLREQVIAVPGLATKRVPVITMGVDTERFVPRERRRSTTFTIATVARLNAMKGHRYVLEAMKMLSSRGIAVRYIIAGDGPFRADIERIVRDLELTASVEMRGTLAESEVLDLLAEIDAFVLASEGLGEAAPVSVMEAMSMGRPVVCSKIGGTPDMLTNGVDGLLVEQRDVAGIADALAHLVEDPRAAESLGAAARARAVAAFDYRRCAAMLAEQIRASGGGR
ncbi:MAG: glycosyltransferase family 4 protein [Myxococcota bacterium]|nr:glycosyltransferase family 4 protein [Myxococcota bacterium]